MNESMNNTNTSASLHSASLAHGAPVLHIDASAPVISRSDIVIGRAAGNHLEYPDPYLGLAKLAA